MDRRLRPVVGAVAFSGAFLTGVMSAGTASAAERTAAPVGGPEVAAPPTVAQTGQALIGKALSLVPTVATKRAEEDESPAGPRCDSSQPRGDDHTYQGASVSALYDKLFHPGPAMPYLSSHVPQSLATLTDWDGQGHDLLLLGMYREHEDALLVGLNPDTQHVVGTVRVASSHLGGMAFLGDYLFAGDNPWPHAGSPTVTRYRTSDLRRAMRASNDNGTHPYLKSDGGREDVHATDFMTTVGDSLYTGNHGNPGHGVMYRYRLNDNGWLKPVEGPWAVPPRAQGMIATSDHFIFSSDNGSGRGWLTVVKRSAPARPVSCVWLPSMPEDILNYHGRMMMAFEGGTARYAHDKPANRITHLHTGSLSPVLDLDDPAALVDDSLGGLLHTFKSAALTQYEARLHDVNHLLTKVSHKG